MDMLDYRMHHAVMATEERASRLRERRRIYLEPEEIQPSLAPSPAGDRPSGIAGLASLVVAFRQGR
jgi:hypothetical protein